MDVVSIALSLANLVPAIAKLVAGDSAGEMAQKVVDVAHKITGKDGEAIIDDMNKNPDMQSEFKKEMLPILRNKLYATLKEEFDEAEEEIKVKIDKILNEII